MRTYLYQNVNGDYVVSLRPNHNDLDPCSATDLYENGIGFTATWFNKDLSSSLGRMIKRGGIKLFVIKEDPLTKIFNIPTNYLLDEPLYIFPRDRKDMKTNYSRQEKNISSHPKWWKQSKPILSKNRKTLINKQNNPPNDDHDAWIKKIQETTGRQ